MLQYERQQSILEYLRQHRSTDIRTLAGVIYASEASIRRDIAVLESAGLVVRVYGGVTLPEHRNDVAPVELRESANNAAKEIIAQQAAALIGDNETVFFDDSSTVRRMCKHLKQRKGLRIVTNNLRVCQELKDTEIDVYCTGGEFFKRRDCFLGAYAERFLSTVYADSVFFSCKGLSHTGVLTDVSEAEISMRQMMLRQAKNKYLLCDSSKLGCTYAFTLCHADELTRILCDVPITLSPIPVPDRG